ncbi:MAG: DNA polymerase IV [Candidatus Krumholzibacteriota bacterium]|nr:DNA polymerase IV [Candidatus Krumholzibacteriota bacterium]
MTDRTAAARVIAHIDMDAFYASVEVLDDPSLRGRPVIVGGASRRGVVSAASYEARAFGVRSAMPVFEARRRCPGGVFLPGRMSRYRDISRLVMGILCDFSPLVEQVSIDEAYVDLTGTERLHGPPRTTALLVKRRIGAETGLTCSVGVSTCKLVAKIASDINKPDGLTIVAPEEVAAFLAALPIGKVPGIGEKSGAQLAAAGIRTLGDAGRFGRDALESRFGALGRRLARIADGGEDSPVTPVTPPKSVSGEVTLEEDTTDTAEIRRLLLRQAERVGRRLRRQGLAGRTVVLKLRHADFRLVTRSVTLDRPTRITRTIYREAIRLHDAYDSREPIRLVGVGVTNLARAGGGQLDFFDGDGDGDEGRWERAERAMDEIVERFGDGAVGPGTLAGDRRREDDPS